MAYSDPVVIEVIELYHACATQMGAMPAMLLPLDPPALLWHGLLKYSEAVDRIRHADERAREEARSHG